MIKARGEKKKRLEKIETKIIASIGWYHDVIKKYV
jgi:hypothetical protein